MTATDPLRSFGKSCDLPRSSDFIDKTGASEAVIKSTKWAFLMTVAAMLLASCQPDSSDLPNDGSGWLYPADTCPADFFPRDSRPIVAGPADCEKEVGRCWDACRRGFGTECYRLAVYTEQVAELAEHSRALFLRSCALGIDSGCTNAAVKLSPAGTDALSDSPIVACENATYRLTCEAGDPWGCTMLGNHIGRGIGFAVDLEESKKYFSRACELDPESQGCEYAQKNMEGVRKLEAERDNSEEG